MESKRSIYEVQLSNSQATRVELPPEVLQTCRESLGVLKAALESGAFERAVSGNLPADSARGLSAR